MGHDGRVTEGNKRMSFTVLVQQKRSALALSVLVAASFVAAPAMAEKLYTKVTRDEARELSSPLKTFICLGERIKPDWCEEFRKSKLTVRVKPKPPEPKKKDINFGIMDFASIYQPDLVSEMEAIEAEAIALAEAKEREIAEAKQREEELKAKEESIREKEFRIFLGKGDYSRLTSDELEMLTELAENKGNAEANEILGFAYINGSGVVGKSKVKAYRQYGIAYLKGLTRVKPNMDLLWKQFTKSEQFALIHEFNELKKDQNIVSSSLEE